MSSSEIKESNILQMVKGKKHRFYKSTPPKYSEATACFIYVLRIKKCNITTLQQIYIIIKNHVIALIIY